jgi:hypothetical protein
LVCFLGAASLVRHAFSAKSQYHNIEEGMPHR